MGSQVQTDSESGASMSATEIIENALQNIHFEELRVIAQLSACGTELINRTIENWMVESQQNQDQEEYDEGDIPRPHKSLVNAVFIEKLSDKLADEISEVSSDFVRACRTISSFSIDSFREEEITQFVRSKVKSQINAIYADTGDAIAKVHDSKEFTIPIFQWIYIL